MFISASVISGNMHLKTSTKPAYVVTLAAGVGNSINVGFNMSYHVRSIFS